MSLYFNLNNARETVRIKSNWKYCGAVVASPFVSVLVKVNNPKNIFVVRAHQEGLYGRTRRACTGVSGGLVRAHQKGLYVRIRRACAGVPEGLE